MGFWQDLVDWCKGLFNGKEGSASLSDIYGEYKMEVTDRLNMLDDDFLDKVVEKAKSVFSDKNFKRQRNLIPVEANIFSRVINQISKVFLEVPTRRNLVAKKGETGDVLFEPDETYSELLKKSNINAIMRDVEEKVNASNECVVMTSWNPKTKSVKYTPITMDQIDLICDDTDDSEIIGVKYSAGSYTVVWTSDGKIETYDGKTLVDEKENPYKDKDGGTVLPFVLYHRKYPSRGLINKTLGSDLYTFTIDVNVLLMMLNYGYKMNYIQPYFSGEKVDTGKLEGDVASPWVVEGIDVEVGKLDFLTNLENQWEVIKERAVMLASFYNVSPSNFTLSGIPSSGVALRISNQGLLDSLKKSRALYEMVEREMFEQSRIIWNHHNSENQVDVKGEFEVIYHDPELPEDFTEEDEHWTTQIEYNVKTAVDWIMSNNKNLTREQALKVYESNKTFNEANQPPEMGIG